VIGALAILSEKALAGDKRRVRVPGFARATAGTVVLA
jgi:hypothetical protein